MISLFLILLCLGGRSIGSEPARTWTSSDGRQLVGSFISADDDSLILKLESGRETRVSLDRLSGADLEYIKGLRRLGQTFAFKSLPAETSIPGKIEVVGGPRIFRSTHFEFETDREVSKAFVAEAARVYEGTYEALSGLPHGLELSPPDGQDFYRGRFLVEEAFDEVVSEKMTMIRGQRVVGLYLSDQKELLVPYSSLGAKSLGSLLTLRKSADTTTLIHEIVHQLMHDWLPLIPTWMAEGMSEYMAAVPYQNGRFEFRNAERGLKERLESQYQIRGNKILGVVRPSKLLGLNNRESISATRADPDGVMAGVKQDEWVGTVNEYRDVMLFVYFLMHLDQPERQGASVAAYLRLVDSALMETNILETEVLAFEKRRLVYNDEVKQFNEALSVFRNEIEKYNSRVRQYNDEVKQEVEEASRIDVGEAPESPVPPVQLEMPDSMKAAVEGGVISLPGLVNKKSLPALIKNRSGDEIDRAMVREFRAIGLEIGYGL